MFRSILWVRLKCRLAEQFRLHSWCKMERRLELRSICFLPTALELHLPRDSQVARSEVTTVPLEHSSGKWPCPELVV